MRMLMVLPASCRAVVLFLLGLQALLAASLALAHEGHDHGAAAAPLAISLVFDAQGTLWRASVKDGHVLVDSSPDNGQHFDTPRVVNPDAQKIGVDGDAKPKLAIGSAGQLYVTWTQALQKPYTGYIWFARSVDGGKHFEPPFIVHQDRAEITHRFDALAVTRVPGQAQDRLYVAWVDKRDLLAAQAAGQPYAGAAIYYAVSDDGGASFAAERKLADSSCECCRIALVTPDDGSGDAVALWRHVFEGGVRDHAIARFNTKPVAADAIKRASFGNWQIDACPHHGPALAQGGDWGWHMAWFDGGTHNREKMPGLFYARMDGEAWVSSPAKRIGDGSKQAGHPALISRGDAVWLAWREMEADGSRLYLMRSQDGGRSWGAAEAMLSTAGSADYPMLLMRGTQVYLAWNTARDGLLLKSLEMAP
jgi:hypothetical protein